MINYTIYRDFQGYNQKNLEVFFIVDKIREQTKLLTSPKRALRVKKVWCCVGSAHLKLPAFGD